MLCTECFQPVNTTASHSSCPTCRSRYRNKLLKSKHKRAECRSCKRRKLKTCSYCMHHWLKRISYRALGNSKYAQLLLRKAIAQKWRCYLSGAPLIPGHNMSLDHIFPSSRWPQLRSDPTNVAWTTPQVNGMKLDMTPSEFFWTMRGLIHIHPTDSDVYDYSIPSKNSLDFSSKIWYNITVINT